MIKVFGTHQKSTDFKNCYDNYHKEILKHITFITGSPYIAEDLCQETFMKLYSSPPEHSNVLAWLKKVSANLAYNYIRNQNTRTRKDYSTAEDDATNVVSIEDAAIRNIEVRMTRKVLNGLPPRDRLCLLLKFSGYKYTEIAEIIGVEASSIGTILARVQAKFKENYSKEVQ